MSYSPLVNFLLKATRKSSRLLLRDYFELENLQHSKRPTTDFTAKSKAKLDEALREEFMRYPSSSISYETGKIDATKNMHFLVKLIDGELNLSRSIPFFANIVVACECKDGELSPIASVINFPALGEIIYAENGKGVFMERSVDNASMRSLRLRVSVHDSFDQALIMGTGSFNHQRYVGCDIYSGYLVASGKADIFLSNSIDNQTALALSQIVNEAGGRVYRDKDIKGNKTKFIACNSQSKFD